MTLLAEEPGLTQQEIVERSFSDPSTVRAMLELLEDRGWVRRDSDPDDARVRRVSLTTDGRKQQRRLQRIGHIGDPAHMEKLLTDAELRVVAECLKRIANKQVELGISEVARSTRNIPIEG